MRNLRVVFVAIAAIACSSSSPKTDPIDDETPTPDCDSNVDCDDSTFCNGAEACVDGVCVSGQAVANDQACDLGAGQSGLCHDSICVSATCGNGVVTAGEDCDNGPTNSDASCVDCCRTDCTLQRCGDNVIDTDEVCDDGDDQVADGCNACQIGEVATTSQGLLYGVGVNGTGVMAVGVRITGESPERRAEIVQPNGTRSSSALVDDGGVIDLVVLDNGAIASIGTDVEGCASKLGLTISTTPPLHACINAGAESAPAITAAGSSIVVVWQAQEGGNLDIHLQRFNFGASLTTAGSEYLVNNETDGPQTAPRVAMNSNGFVVAWLDGTAVCYRRFDSVGAAVMGQITASTSAFPKSDIRVALTADGIVLNWAEALDAGVPHRFLRAFDSDVPVSAPFDVGVSAYVSGVTVLTSPSERLVVGINGTLAHYTNADPPVLQNTVQMSTCPEASLRGTLVQAHNDRIIAAWDTNGTTACTGVHFQRFDSDGAAVGLGALD